MRSRLVCLIILLAALSAAVPLYAQQAAPPIPPYPGSKAEFELNLTQQDFLPVIRQWITLAPGALAGFLSQSGPVQGMDQNASNEIAQVMKDVATELQSVLAGLNQVSVLAYRRPEQAGAEQITDFYMRELALGQDWLRPFAVDRPEGSAKVFVKPDLAAMIGIGVSSEYVAVARTEGKIDFTALGAMAAKYIPMIVSHLDSGPADQTEGPAVEAPQDTSGEWSVVLMAVGAQRVRVLGTIRELTGMTPVEAREFVQSLPNTLMSGVSWDEAGYAKTVLEAAGATVETRKVQ